MFNARLNTFSIVACDLKVQSWGVAVASKYLAVGAVVPFARASVGALATQCYSNMTYGEQGFSLMNSGASAEAALQALLDADPAREDRQVGLVDASGRAASFTGKHCDDWAGSIVGPQFAIQGNLLVGRDTLDVMVGVFETAQGELADRLCQALLAGDQAGGDRRGKQSAALVVAKPNGGYGGFTDRYLDLRVDDHPQPVAELARLLKLHHLYRGQSLAQDKIKVQGRVAQDLQALLIKQGYLPGRPEAGLSPTARAALNKFIVTENLEERFDPAGLLIDPPALDYLLEKYA